MNYPRSHSVADAREDPVSQGEQSAPPSEGGSAKTSDSYVPFNSLQAIRGESIAANMGVVVNDADRISIQGENVHQ